MKKLIASIAVLITVVTLTGCREEPSPTDVQGLYADTITLPDGRTVTCVHMRSGVAGAITCDWNNAS
ncbi:hypothetical protein [Demequina sp.]|uniref:hypothetical protein n=1 Tax=Demequina sp. TaxID=2050685 RepID=UPI0025B97124|nr:hypothetical protein [Demequina sp.]